MQWSASFTYGSAGTAQSSNKNIEKHSEGEDYKEDGRVVLCFCVPGVKGLYQQDSEKKKTVSEHMFQTPNNAPGAPHLAFTVTINFI